jgi:Spx/MgsR family transcriptional regulator
MIVLYGIPNCDTVKKSRAWLAGRGIDYAFHDFKKAGLDDALLRGWAAELGWEPLLNRKGTTWRKLAESEREGVDAESAIRLMLGQPSLVKRPVLDRDGALHLGFSEALYAEIFAP